MFTRGFLQNSFLTKSDNEAHYSQIRPCRCSSNLIGKHALCSGSAKSGLDQLLSTLKRKTWTEPREVRKVHKRSLFRDLKTNAVGLFQFFFFQRDLKPSIIGLSLAHDLGVLGRSIRNWSGLSINWLCWYFLCFPCIGHCQR